MWLNTDKPPPDALVDTTFTFLLGLGRENMKEGLAVKSVKLTRQKPTHQYLDSYYGDNLQFSCDKNIITPDRSVLDAALDTYNQALSDMIMPQLETGLSESEDKQPYMIPVDIIFAPGIA